MRLILRMIRMLTLVDKAQRAAAQRKPQPENNPRMPQLTPQQFSQRRAEQDSREAALRREQIRKAQENHMRLRAAAVQNQALLQAQQQQQNGQNGVPNQQRPDSSSNAAGQQVPMQANGQAIQPQPAAVNGQMQQQQQARGQVPMATRNGHLAVPQVNGQGVPQAQMRMQHGQMSAQDMQWMAQANAQVRNGQYTAQQQYAMQKANMQSPGGGMTAQQQMQSNQAMMASMQQQVNGTGQASSSPSMPPPPAPVQQKGQPQSLSSGHVPALFNIQAQLRQRHPHATDQEIIAKATEMLQSQSQSSSQARLSAMNAAAGINGQAQHANMQAYAQNQAAYGGQMPNGTYSTDQQASVANSPSPQQYAQMMRQRQMQQMRMQQSPQGSHAQLANGSPSMEHASPNMQYANPMPSMNMQAMPTTQGMQQRPPSRSATPGGMGQSPVQGSPRPVGVGR
jgi:chromatin modification-related protein VID21